MVLLGECKVQSLTRICTDDTDFQNGNGNSRYLRDDKQKTCKGHRERELRWTWRGGLLDGALSSGRIGRRAFVEGDVEVEALCLVAVFGCSVSPCLM